MEVFREDLGVEGPDVPLPRLPRRLFANGLQSMDGVDIRHVFHRRPLVMKSVPKFMQGAFRGGLRALMEDICASRLARDVLRQIRGWKAFLLLPRMSLHKPPRGGLIPKRRLEERLELFARGDWMPLLRASEQVVETGAQASVRRAREAGCPCSSVGADGRVEFLPASIRRGRIGTRHVGDIGCIVRSGAEAIRAQGPDAS